MSDKNENKRIDDLVNHIDDFMTKGGGRMNVKGGEGDPNESYCHSCCGEGKGDACNTPVNK